MGWLTRNATARLGIRNHVPLAERAHFGQHKTAKTLFDAVVARYSSPAIAALGRLIVPYLFPELSAFPIVADLITHLRTSDTLYRAALKTEFLDKNPFPTYITPYFLVTRIPDSLHAVLLVALLALPSLRGVPPPPLPPLSLLLLLLTSFVLRRSGLRLLLVGGAATARAREARVVEVAAVEAVVEVVVAVGVAVGVVVGVEASVAAVVAVGVVVGVEASVTAVVVVVVAAVVAAVGVVAATVVTVVVEPFRGEILAVARGNSSLCARPLRPSNFVSALLSMGRLGVVFATPDVPPDPGIEAAALGASASALSGTAPAKALHTFMLDSVLARSSTVLPCPAVPSGSLSGLHLPSFSTNLVSTAALQDAMVTTSTSGGHRVAICTCTRTGRHLATFTRRPGSTLYTLTTEPTPGAVSGQVSASGQVAAPGSCRLRTHQTLLSHHHLGHPSLPRLRGKQSRFLVSGLPRSLPPLPSSPALFCLPCVEGRQRAAPHSSSFPPTTAPLQTLHMDVWGPVRVRGHDRERYFLLVVDDYCRYTTVFPMRSKGEVPYVFIPLIHTVRLQLREQFRQDLPVLRLHSDRGGEFSSDLLWDFCRGEGFIKSFTLPASPQQNGIAERRIGLVMEVAHTSMIHAAAPQFLWPFTVWSLPTPLVQLRGGDVAADDAAAPGHSPRLETPPGFLPQPSSPPLQPVAVDSGALGGGVPRGAESGGAEPEGAEPGGAEPEGAEPGGAEPESAEPGGAEPRSAEPSGLVGESLSHHSSCASGLLGAPAFGVARLELKALPLEALTLEALELEALELVALELEALELEALELETLELEALELEALELETLELEALEL
ncbi:unnamed protein product [Closterium sp. Yama58-4]|nr:unnamed protein product [Closterium sp. Yama58-4]